MGLIHSPAFPLHRHQAGAGLRGHEVRGEVEIRREGLTFARTSTKTYVISTTPATTITESQPE
jgi:hypothetical protein